MSKEESEIRNEYKNATDILRYICNLQEKTWRSDVPLQDAKNTYHRLIGRLCFNSIYLEKVLDTNWNTLKSDSNARKSILLLPPLPNGYVPALRINYEEERDEIGFEVVFYHYNKNENKWSSYGFRYEPPHRVNKTNSKKIIGMHEYHHAQVTTQIRNEPNSVHLNIPEDMGDLDDRIPCIPLPADGLTSLILCMYLSIYGRKEFIRLRNATKILPKYLEPMECIKK